MSEGASGSTLSRELDEILAKYLERRKLEEKGGIFGKESSKSEIEEPDCRFKDNCYAFKSGMGSCPCELNE